MEEIMIGSNIVEYNEKTSWEIGKRIQEVRISKGLAGVDVAACLGIGKNQLSRIENGRANCTISQLFVLSQILECSTDYILFGNKMRQSYNAEQMQAISAIISAFCKKG
jgi:transcriptional regulator with XRE-family HTH domain